MLSYELDYVTSKMHLMLCYQLDHVAGTCNLADTAAKESESVASDIRQAMAMAPSHVS
jgi:hypothetical protein